MKLLADIGNTAAKFAVMNENGIVARRRVACADESVIDGLFAEFPLIDKAIVSSTGECGDAVHAMICRRVPDALRLTPSTPVPLRNGYASPATLGTDRIAAAVGAQILYGRRNMMIVDFGTAITVDLVIDGEFRGGNISPGVGMRFRALHEWTSALPLCSATDAEAEFGRTTHEAVEQGVMRGVELEIEGYMARFGARYENLSTILTGGDAIFFDKRIKNTIFASRDLMFVGLNGILEYNVER